ncbi:unnamed protein product [Blepharisma stoltei]|uniref:Uncharacterized protein n=1 Tax=Blepharisma stoltei TaxID=1481888 RepID=A0AAU9J610_9CILI|nr:unnamed protein product [Blepharisma stoltei]
MKSISFHSPNPKRHQKNPRSPSKSKSADLSQYLNTKLSFILSEYLLDTVNAGIPLYDSFSIVDSPPKHLMRKNKLKHISSKSVKNLPKQSRVAKLPRAISHKVILGEVENTDNDSRHYVYYDELNRSRSKKKRIQPIQSRNDRSPYSSNWNVKALNEFYKENIKRRSTSLRLTNSTSKTRSSSRGSLLRSMVSVSRFKSLSPDRTKNWKYKS